MRQAVGAGEELSRKVVVAAGDADGATAARRRRRHGRKVASGEVEPARKATDGSESESSADVGRGIWLPASLSHGAVSVIGRRREMEDAVAVERTFLASPSSCEGGDEGGGGEEDFFAVYDGHGGARVAEACRERMHVVLAEEVGRLRCRPGARGWKEALEASFARVDGEVVAGAGADDGEESRSRTVGSTAVVAVVGRRRIVVANCGDSRAVLSRGGVAVPLSTDHKVHHTSTPMYSATLAMSSEPRDYYLKPYVSAEPEVMAVERTGKDEFLVLASDGLWDVVSNQEACRVARSCLTGRAAAAFPESVSGRSAADAAALLAELAITRGSKDNISVVVVELKRLKSRVGRRAAIGSEVQM
uniref:protein-serine/threonine phosphatase n=1 Tax=Aegilops tauschii subsp. strangulata TaxID=200361 RepID=A0A452ZYZ0_AEGTS